MRSSRKDDTAATGLPDAELSETDGASTGWTGGRGPVAGDRVGRYVVEEQIGRGAYGVVYAAHDPVLGRRVAVKFLVDDLSAAASDEALRLEAQIMAGLAHPNIVAVLDFGTWRGSTYLTMEHLDGPTLERWLNERERPAAAILAAFIAAGRGLAAAHAHGVVHGDFKPANVLMDAESRPSVADFGVARHFDSVATDPTRRGQVGSMFTRPRGTPRYMSPEQFAGEAPDQRSDAFSFCVALYEALWGRHPYGGNTVHELALAITAGQLRASGAPVGVTRRTAAAIERGLARDPEARFPSMDELLAALDMSPSSRWRRPTLVAGLLGSAAIGVAVFGRHEERACLAGRLEGAWDPEQAVAVQAGILATQAPFAPAVWSSLHQRLDAYADQWHTGRAEVCASADARHARPMELELRVACLRGLRDDLLALTGALSKADPRLAEVAVAHASALRPVEACTRGDVEAYARPDDPAVATEVEVLRRRLSEAKRRRLAVDFAGWARIARDVLERAQAIGAQSVVAEANLELGRAEIALGNRVEAEVILKRALFTAKAERQDRIAAVAATTLVHLVGEVLARPDEGLEWRRHAYAALERIEGPQLRAELLRIEGEIHARLSRWDEAVDALEHATRLMAQVGPAMDRRRALTVHSLASVYMRRGEYATALPLLEAALASMEGIVGTEHPDYAEILHKMGVVRHSVGDFSGARAAYERALAISERAGETDAATVDTLHNFAALSLAEGRAHEAQRLFARVLRIQESSLGPDHHDIASTLNNMGVLSTELGDYARARAQLQRASRIWDELRWPDQPDAAALLDSMGDLAAAQGDHLAAMAYYKRGLAIAERVLVPGHPLVAELRTALGAAELESGTTPLD